MQLNTKLKFEKYLDKVESKVNKTIHIIRKLQIIIPITPIHKLFIRPHLDYGNIIYDKASNGPF